MAIYQSKEWRENISKAKKGKDAYTVYWTGKKFSDKHKEKIRIAIKGSRHSEESKKKISEAKRDNKNPMWKGDKVGYIALHAWVRRRLLKPILCSRCKKRKAIDLANISGQYKRDLSDWIWICRHCHMFEDGRINNLKKGKNEE